MGKKRPNSQLSVPVVQIADLEDAAAVAVAHSAAYHAVEEPCVVFVRQAVLDWFWTHRRRLPWRGDEAPFNASIPSSGSPDQKQQQQQQQLQPHSQSQGLTAAPSAYHVWVSEIMLQQTRVATVIDYYLRWFTAFPTLADLAAATEEEVTKLWAGLGYYRRARYLHNGAKYIMEECNGQVPNTLAGLKKVPGIGDYTAGAIGSIAFSLPVPVVDGNVIRVMSRLRGVAAPKNQKSALTLYWQWMAQFVDPTHPGDFNQSMIELGACICTPKSPNCAGCPVQSQCIAYAEEQAQIRPLPRLPQEGKEEEKTCSVCLPLHQVPVSVLNFPTKLVKPPPVPSWHFVCLLIRPQDDNKPLFLVLKRPKTGLLCGQWEFPTIQVPEGATLTTQQTAMEEELSRRLQGYDSTAASVSVTATERGVIKHVFSHRVHHMTIGWQYVSPASSEQPLVCPENTRCWMTEQELKDVGLTTGQKKILRLYIKAQQTSKPAKKKRKVKKKSKKQQQLPAPAAASTTAVKTEHTLLGMFAKQRNKNNNKKHTTKAPEDVPALE